MAVKTENERERLSVLQLCLIRIHLYYMYFIFGNIMLVIRNLICAVVYRVVNMLYHHARDETTLVPCVSNYITVTDSF